MGGEINLIQGEFQSLNSSSYSDVIKTLNSIKDTLKSTQVANESEAAMRQYVDLLGRSKLRRDLKGNKRTGTKGANYDPSRIRLKIFHPIRAI